MIRLEGLEKSYGSKKAVDGLSVTVPAGTVYAFLGPNGAGKTTTIKMITGLLRPDRGRILLGGISLHDEPLRAKRTIGYIPDQPYLYEKLTAREFLEFVARMHALDPGEYRPRMESLFERFDVARYADDTADGYSHGMRQRVVVCAALIHAPRILVIDEPLVGLDPLSARRVKNLLREHVRDGGAVFVSTHTLSAAEEMADRIGIIADGVLRVEGTREEILAGGGERSLEDAFLRWTGGGNGTSG